MVTANAEHNVTGARRDNNLSLISYIVVNE